MELRHLRYFIAVAEELHFGRAAVRLGIAQPPLSHQIQQLERELGVCLLERTNRRVSLTEAGRAFLDQARVSLAHAGRAADHARMAEQGQIGQVTVGFADTTMLGIVPAAVRAYRSRYPQVKLTLLQMRSHEQISSLKDGRIDVGVIIRGPAHDKTVLLTPLFHEPWVVALPADNVLAGQSELSLGDLANEPMIFFSHQRDYGSYDEFARMCNAAGFVPHWVEEASGILVALGLVAAGLGLAMVSSSCTSIGFPNVVFRPVTHPTPGVEVAAIRRQNETSPTALAFSRVLSECAAHDQPPD